jgi:hypothetical protein
MRLIKQKQFQLITLAFLQGLNYKYFDDTNTNYSFIN